MLYLARNFELIKNREKTYLTAAVNVADTTLTVKAVDSNAWADNDWIIVGEIGTKNAEILQINGAVSDGTSLTIDNAGSGGARFVHSADEPVYRIDYNQAEFSRAATATGSKSVLATNELQVDDVYTRYEDTTNTTGYGFVRFKNSLSGAFSAYSPAIPYTGYTAKSLGRMQRLVRKRLNEPDFRSIGDEDITEELNEKQRDIAHERLWPFYETTRSTPSVAYQVDYTISTGVSPGKIHAVTFRSKPLIKVGASKFDILHWDTSQTGTPTHALVWDNKIRLYPTPPDAAATDQLNGAITATSVTITVDSTSGFSPSGRILIESEIISYSSLTSTTFRGCVRGEEGTTAAIHSDDVAVAEQDIVYTAHEEPTELVDTTDETNVPDPNVLVNGVAMELAIGKLKDEGLHDRLKAKYEEGLKALRDKFGKKQTFMNYRIRETREALNDDTMLRNPNDYSQITGA